MKKITANKLQEVESNTETKYRPFRTHEECWTEMQKHNPFGYLKDNLCGSFYHLCSVRNENGCAMIVFGSNPDIVYNAEDLYFEYTFADGEPFGLKIM